jgi:hypothetical protein
VALLVDGENMSSAHANEVMETARKYGEPTVRRVYGKAEQITGWEQEGFRLVPSRHGKNSADLLLCVEAMSLALREKFHTVLIGSSDRDYAYLCEHLRELGHQVIGIGERKTAGSFRKACSHFVEMKTIEAPVAAVKPVPQVAKAVPKLSDLDKKLKGHIPSEGIVLSALANAMREKTVKEWTGRASWRKYLESKPDLFRTEGTKVFCVT